MEGAAGWLSVVVATATSYEVQLVSLAHARDVLTAEVVSSCPCAAPSALQFYCDCEGERRARARARARAHARKDGCPRTQARTCAPSFLSRSLVQAKMLNRSRLFPSLYRTALAQT